MRSIHIPAAVTAALVLASACSDDGGGIAPPNENAAPVANFAVPACTIGVACDFASTSTDDAQVTEWSWDFDGDGTPDANTGNASHMYAAAGTFNVSLTVRDAQGLSDTKTSPIGIDPADPGPVDPGPVDPGPVDPGDPINTPPTAAFTYTCADADCSFSSTSTDAPPGTIVAHAWTFGDGGTADVANPSHRYAVVNPTNFTVTLTVTDNEGATDVATQVIAVSPPPPGAEGCTTSGTRVDCRLDIASRSNIKLKLIGISCDLRNQRIVIPPPSSDQVFLNVCSRTVGDSTRIFGGPLDEAFIYEAGSQATIRFVQGTADAGEPAPNPPVGQVTGSFPNWIINFEDGDNPGAPGEPDFADVVLQVDAIPAP